MSETEDYLRNELAELSDHARHRIHTLTQQVERYEKALKRIADLTQGHEGKTAQMMMMGGVSPVRLLAEGRDIALNAMEGGHPGGQSGATDAVSATDAPVPDPPDQGELC